MTSPDASPGNLEIERRFLVRPADGPPAESGVRITQGYLATSDRVSVRVRIGQDQDFGLLTIKSRHSGATRYEYEYPIPLADGQDFLYTFCDRVIEKVRCPIVFGTNTWVVDRFLGSNTGLCIAECEMTSADLELAIPLWCGLEITDDDRFRNDHLASLPISSWSTEERANFKEIG